MKVKDYKKAAEKLANFIYICKVCYRSFPEQTQEDRQWRIKIGIELHNQFVS